jgi:hypothetical protein
VDTLIGGGGIEVGNKYDVKTQYLLCKTVCIGGRDSYFLKMGVWGRMARHSLTLLGEGYLLFPRGLIFALILCYNKPKGIKILSTF